MESSRPAIPKSHLLGLVGMIAVYTLALTYLCQLRFESFGSSTFDLGVNQQLLWTASHGSLLYETPDRVTTGIHSFLEIHSTYIAFLIAPLYEAIPYPATLFALQSAAAGSAVFPLYLISRKSNLSSSLVFPLLALYLVNFGVIAALFFDFHWEVFLPAELLWFYYLFRRRSFALALVPTAVGFLTLEIYPVLGVGVVIVFLYEKLVQLGLRPGVLLRDRDVRVALGFVAVLSVLYVLFLVSEHQVIPSLVGTQGSIGVYTGVNPSFQFSAAAQTVPVSAIYWLLLVTSLGFLPLFSPRSLLASVPWFVEATFLQPYYSAAFGNQYALIAMATLSIAFVEGFARLSHWADRPPHRPLVMGVLLAAAAGSSMLAAQYSPTLLSGSPPRVVLLLLAGPAAMIIGLVIVSSLPFRPTLLIKFSIAVSPRMQLALLLSLVSGLSDVVLFDVLTISLASFPRAATLAPVWLALLVPPLFSLAIYLVDSKAVEPATRSTATDSRPSPRKFAGVRVSLWAGTVALFVGFNLVMSPLNTLNSGASHRPGYTFEYAASPDARLMGWIVHFIPPNAQVLISNKLFPFAANDPNAWPAFFCLRGTTCMPYLPFNGTNLPRFALTDDDERGEFPVSIQSALTNQSEYGLVAEIVCQFVAPGSVFLYERGFSGETQVRYA